MAKVLLDACVPQWLRTELAGMDVTTARYAGLDEIPDAQLLAAIEDRNDILVTLDGNLPYQQRIAGRRFAVVLLRVRDQTPEAFRALLPELVEAINTSKPGRIRQVVGKSEQA